MAMGVLHAQALGATLGAAYSHFVPAVAEASTPQAAPQELPL